MRRPVIGPDLLREDRSDAELPGRLECEDHAAGRWSCDQVDERLTVTALAMCREERAQLAGRDWILEDLELLDVGVAVPTALEAEVAVPESARGAEERLGPGGDRLAGRGVERRSNGGHAPSLRGRRRRSGRVVRGRTAHQGRYSTPLTDGIPDFAGRAVPIRSR